MGRLIVGSIAAEDFLSYRERQEVHLGGSGPVAVVGTNGAGKSSLVSKALAWCLYGTCAPERMGTSTKAMRGKDVLRRHLEPIHASTPKAESATVEVWLRDVDDGTAYQITRTRKKTGSDKITIRTVNAAAGYDEVDGETQNDIDRLIGATYDVFVRTCLRGQNDPWNFAEATDSKKREILDTISGADMLNEPHKRAKAAKVEAEREAATLAARAADAERRAAGIDVSALEDSARKWADGRVTRLQTAQAEVDALATALADAKAHDAAAAGHDQARTTLAGQRPTVDFTAYQTALADAQRREAQAKAALDVATAGKAKAQALMQSGACPECGQPIAEGSMAHQAAHVAISDEPWKAAVTHRQACEKALTDARAWLDAETKAWQAKMDALPRTGQPRTPAAQAAYDMAIKRQDEIKAADNPYEHSAEQARLQRFSMQREAALFRDREKEERRKMRLADAWVEVLAPKGVRAHMAEAALAAIEAEANKWLAILSDGKFSVAFPPTKTTKRSKATREEIQTVIKKGSEDLPFLAFSGGEKRRINLAVDLGVAATFARGGALALSLLVLDEEVFSGLDEEGKAGVVTALHHAGVADVVVIDHDPRLSGVLPRTIRAFIGEDGYSRVEEVS